MRHERAFMIGGLLEMEDGGYVALVGERDGDRLTFRGSVEYGFSREIRRRQTQNFIGASHLVVLALELLQPLALLGIPPA